jgi:hypothetical protein
MLVSLHQLNGPPLKSLLPSWRNQLRSCGLARLLSAMSFKLALSLTPCQGEEENLAPGLDITLKSNWKASFGNA